MLPFQRTSAAFFANRANSPQPRTKPGIIVAACGPTRIRCRLGNLGTRIVTRLAIRLGKELLSKNSRLSSRLKKAKKLVAGNVHTQLGWRGHPDCACLI